MYNLPYEDMHAPIAGPAHPFQKDGLAAGHRNHFNGHVEDTGLAPFHFDEQYNMFHAKSYGHAPGTNVLVGKGLKAQPAADDDRAATLGLKRRKTADERKADAERKAAERSAPIDPSQPFTLGQRQPWAEKVAEVSELTDEQKEYMAKIEEEKAEAGGDGGGPAAAKGPTSIWHGKAQKTDYQGRSWLEGPKDKKCESDYCYLPKKWVHTWSGHTKGVNKLQFFPGTAHLLLSAGNDGKVKIWDVFGSKKCMRTYNGHSKGVRDITFSNDGRRFVSCGYDKNVHVWDTETGKVIRTFNTGKVHYCVTLHPEKQNMLMSGCGDKKIYQFDIDTGDTVQEYNYHLGPVNSVTFINGGQQFVSTSDDKSIRMWEFGIPVQIRYIADPAMHSCPVVTSSPKNDFLLMQSLDNQIITYGCKDKFKELKNKNFKGHNTAGYACQVNFSPDRRYVMSGDSEGRCFFWEWGNPKRIVRTIKAHEGVCIGAVWNPMESSKVATCGWDGLIKYWD
jgi:pre-mRNA-processing factor 17